MGLFGFDSKYAMFGTTPVDNQFILEYLPEAPDGYVKVYLYGLLQCYHPSKDLDVDALAHILSMEKDEIMTAFRYWERRGFVERISDNPPAFRYVNRRQKESAGAFVPDPEYERFGENLYGAFNNERRLHGNEISQCYEWVEELHLAPEVVIMLIKHMIYTKGKNFKISTAESVAMMLADEGANTLEAADEVLSRERSIYDGTRNILKRFGKRRLPSEDEQKLYRKWVREWGFTDEMIQEACGETVKGDPNMGYLDGILSRIREKTKNGNSVRKAEDVRRALDDHKPLKELLSVLGTGSVNDTTLDIYQKMLEIYSAEVILLAGRECAARSGGLEDVQKLLEAWNKRGLRNETDILEYIDRFKAQNRFISELKDLWGARGHGNAAERSMLTRWTEQWGFRSEAILYAASFASGKDNPMVYLDTVLKKYAEKGIHTSEEMERDHENFSQVRPDAHNPSKNTVKTVYAQQYTQREYDDSTNYLDRLMSQESDGNA